MPFARGVLRNSVIECLNFQQKRITKKVQRKITPYLRRNEFSDAIFSVDLTSESEGAVIDLTGDRSSIDLTGDDNTGVGPIIDLTGN